MVAISVENRALAIDVAHRQGEDAAIAQHLRMTPPMFRSFVASFGLAFVFLAGPVLATEIPKEQSDKDYKECIESPHDKKYSDEKWAAFCKCNIDGTKAQFSYEEYQKLVSDINAGTLANPDSMNKFKSVAASCNTKMLQP